MKNYIENIKSLVGQVGGANVHEQIIDDQEIIAFQITSNGKPLNVALFHRGYEEQNQLMLQLFASFAPIYDEPGADFYQVLERFNLNSIIGHIFFSHEEEIHRISYKSNCVLDIKDPAHTVNIKIFLETSILMMGEFDQQLSLI
jgi:hypothetical protein